MKKFSLAHWMEEGWLLRDAALTRVAFFHVPVEEKLDCEPSMLMPKEN